MLRRLPIAHCGNSISCWSQASAVAQEVTANSAIHGCRTAGMTCNDLAVCLCRTPFADLPFVPKMHAICNPHHRVSFPELANKDLMDVMRRCLDRDPKSRITLQVHRHTTSFLGLAAVSTCLLSLCDQFGESCNCAPLLVTSCALA